MSWIHPFARRRHSRRGFRAAGGVHLAFRALVGAAGLWGALVSAAAAQSWAFVEVERETDLGFGEAIQGAGLLEVPRTSPEIAKFKITGSLPGAGTGQRVVTLTFYPAEELLGPAGGAVDFAMAGAYNATADNAAAATTFNRNSVDIPLQILEGYQGGHAVYSAYAYVYGSLLVGSVPVGAYTGEVTLVAQPRPASGGTGSEGCDVTWDPSVWYNDGDWVEHQGNAWRALWWNAGNVPGSGGPADPWEAMGPCGAPPEGPACEAYAWVNTRIYNSGEWATYGGSAWRALYYTRGETPGSRGASGAWENMGPCDGTPWDGTGCDALSWQPTRVYDSGDEVTHDGKAWRARYYTRGNAPGTNRAWQQIANCGELDVLAAVWRYAPGYWPAEQAYRDSLRCAASASLFGPPPRPDSAAP